MAALSRCNSCRRIHERLRLRWVAHLRHQETRPPLALRLFLFDSSGAYAVIQTSGCLSSDEPNGAEDSVEYCHFTHSPGGPPVPLSGQTVPGSGQLRVRPAASGCILHLCAILQPEGGKFRGNRSNVGAGCFQLSQA